MASVEVCAFCHEDMWPVPRLHHQEPGIVKMLIPSAFFAETRLLFLTLLEYTSVVLMPHSVCALLMAII